MRCLETIKSYVSHMYNLYSNNEKEFKKPDSYKNINSTQTINKNNKFKFF